MTRFAFPGKWANRGASGLTESPPSARASGESAPTSPSSVASVTAPMPMPQRRNRSRRLSSRSFGSGRWWGTEPPILPRATGVVEQKPHHFDHPLVLPRRVVHLAGHAQQHGVRVEAHERDFDPVVSVERLLEGHEL